MKRVVLLVPHGDDEVLLAGASISKHKRAGDKVTVCILKGDKTERNLKQIRQSEEVANFLNVDHIFHLDVLKAGSIDLISKELEYFLINGSYDTLYTIHENDNHQEHRLTFNAISVAVRSHGPACIPNIFCGETLSSTSQRLRHVQTFNPTLYNIVTEEDIDKKIKALSFYTGEIHTSPHQRSPEAIKALAILRGSECFANYAEAFMPLRQIIH